MLRFSAKVNQFEKKGEKSGWSYILLDPKRAGKLKSNSKRSFRVKGRLDGFAIARTAILPMGDGSFILPFNARMRKATGKKAGDVVLVELELDERPLLLSKDFIASLRDDHAAFEFYQTLPRSHQQYFSNWIESAKTIETKTKRITMAVIALASRQGFGEMIRANKGKNLTQKGF